MAPHGLGHTLGRWRGPGRKECFLALGATGASCTACGATARLDEGGQRALHPNGLSVGRGGGQLASKDHPQLHWSALGCTAVVWPQWYGHSGMAAMVLLLWYGRNGMVAVVLWQWYGRNGMAVVVLPQWYGRKGGGCVGLVTHSVPFVLGVGSKDLLPLFLVPNRELAHGVHPHVVVAEIRADRGGGGARAWGP